MVTGVSSAEVDLQGRRGQSRVLVNAVALGQPHAPALLRVALQTWSLGHHILVPLVGNSKQLELSL